MLTKDGDSPNTHMTKSELLNTIQRFVKLHTQIADPVDTQDGEMILNLSWSSKDQGMAQLKGGWPNANRLRESDKPAHCLIPYQHMCKTLPKLWWRFCDDVFVSSPLENIQWVALRICQDETAVVKATVEMKTHIHGHTRTLCHNKDLSDALNLITTICLPDPTS